MNTDIKELFRRAFGYEAPENFSIENAPSRLENSSLGFPYYASPAKGENFYGVDFFLPVKLDGFLLPFAVMNIVCKKNIITTQMTERIGSVHELIAIEDYVINIRGILINEKNEYPEKDIIKLHDLFTQNSSIKIESVLTAIFLKGDTKVIIKSLNFPANEGVEHAKPYEIELESDTAFVLEIDSDFIHNFFRKNI